MAFGVTLAGGFRRVSWSGLSIYGPFSLSGVGATYSSRSKRLINGEIIRANVRMSRRDGEGYRRAAPVRIVDRFSAGRCCAACEEWDEAGSGRSPVAQVAGYGVGRDIAYAVVHENTRYLVRFNGSLSQLEYIIPIAPKGNCRDSRTTSCAAGCDLQRRAHLIKGKKGDGRCPKSR